MSDTIIQSELDDYLEDYIKALDRSRGVASAEKKTVEEWLREVKYTNDPTYTPSEFAMEFVVFIKLVNGSTGEEHKTPSLHYKMLDKIDGSKENIVNMVHRGGAKTAVFGEYLILYLALYNKISGFGKIPLGIYVSDSIENGVKNMRKNLEFRWNNSDFLKKYVPKARFTDTRWEFVNLNGVTTVFKGYGAKALSLDSILYTQDGITTIEECSIGDKIFGADGKLTTITKKSEVFHRDMYKIVLEDGRELKVSDEHINSVVQKVDYNNKAKYVKRDLYTHELVKEKLFHTTIREQQDRPDCVSNDRLLFIENCKPLVYSKKEFPLDPYTLGLLLGDGSMKKNDSCVLNAHIDDMAFYKTKIPYQLGTPYIDKRNGTAESISIKKISQIARDLDIVKHRDLKRIPNIYMFGSIKQRLDLLSGLLDINGTTSKRGRISFISNSKGLIDDVSSLTRSLGGTAKKQNMNKKVFRVELWINYNPFKLKRKAARFKKRTKELVAIVSIDKIEAEPSQCIAVDNDEHQFISNEYFRTHNTGVRGAKEMGQRPYLAILDDLISDEDARSDTVISSVEDTVYKAIDYALHPTRRKTIWSGTPFNASDPLYKAVESGAWYANVFPVCEKFPCRKEEFRGSWEDRFGYDFVIKQYIKAKKTGKLDSFYQEMMLQIASEDDRLLKADEIVFLDFEQGKRKEYNYYICTDFATSEKATADFSVISVWAVDKDRKKILVDGICKKQLMSENIKDLFSLVKKYKPFTVTIEVTGQQKGFVSWIKERKIEESIYFAIQEIRPTNKKFGRFLDVLPEFKLNRIAFSNSLDKVFKEETKDELSSITSKKITSRHDDVIDTISCLIDLDIVYPVDGLFDVTEPTRYDNIVFGSNADDNARDIFSEDF